MEVIDIFLRALERKLKFKEKYFICKRSSTIDEHFPAYKKYRMEVWCIDNFHKEIISTVQIVDKATTEDEKQIIQEKLLGLTYENLLSFYGMYV